jgi:hypothetical protein
VLVVDPNMVYAAIKYWLPMTAFFTLVIRGWRSLKTSLTDGMDKLLNNHLSHIQLATEKTVSETEKTNALLLKSAQHDATVADKVSSVATKLEEHSDRELQVWNSVVKTLAVLEDRTRSSRTPRTPRKRRS